MAYDAFISYSTHDSDFVTALRLALEGAERRVWQDVKELELTAEWWNQIKQGILNADNFLFVVSPRSMASPVCHLELEYARELRKRVIFIRYEPADKTESTHAMVERILTQEHLKLLTTGRDLFGLADENWRAVDAEQSIAIASKDVLLTQVPKLIDAFDKDLLYIKQSTLLLTRAQEWRDSAESASFLLTGAALTAAETWRDAGKRPPPTDLHREYVAASRAAEDDAARRKAEQERRTRRLQRVTLVAVIAVIGAVAAALIAGAQTFDARNQAATAIVAQGLALQVQGTSVAEAGVAREEVAQANAEIATATHQVATSVALQGTAQTNAAIANTQVAVAEATVTQAAVVEYLITSFANIMLEQRDDPRGQIAAMNALVQRFPNEAEAYVLRGLVYAEQNDIARAMEDYSEAIRLNPDNAQAYYNRGLARYDSGDLPGTIEDFTEAIRLDPNQADIYYSRGNARRDSGDLPGAIEDYSDAIRLDPNYALAYNNRGLARQHSGDEAGAVEDYSEAIRLDPNLAIAYNNRGNVLYGSGDFAGAGEDYGEAIRLDPTLVVAHINRGNTRQASGDLIGAIVDYSEAIHLEGDNAPAYINRGIARWTAAQVTRLHRAYLQGALEDWSMAQRLGLSLSEDILASMSQAQAELGGGASPSFVPQGTAQPGDNTAELSPFTIHTWTIDGRAGDSMTITTIAAWDTVLGLWGHADSLLTYNDDGTGLPNFNSQITFTLPASGQYTIVVAGYANAESGEYILRVEADGG